MPSRILRRKEVEAMIGLSRSTIYKLISQEIFPKPVQLGTRAVGWRLSDIEAWLNTRVSK